jgi:hypothetical protein
MEIRITDALISEFGFESGSLTWFQGMDSGLNYQPHVLKNVPGAVKSIVEDMDKDGIKDIIVLMAQGDEHISIFKMNEKGIANEIKILRFPPVHGVCDMDIKDFNYDGKPDIILASGDNADYSQIIKPYHGITIYLNQENMSFKSSSFHTLSRCIALQGC